MKEEFLKDLDNDSLMELLKELENLDSECEEIINKEGDNHE